MYDATTSQPSNFVRNRTMYEGERRDGDSTFIGAYLRRREFPLSTDPTSSSNSCKLLLLVFLAPRISTQHLLVHLILDSAVQLGLKVTSSQ